MSGFGPHWTGSSPPVTERADFDGRRLGEVTTRIISLFAENAGKGPERGKSYLNDNVLVCVLWGGLTELELTLLDRGRTDLVQQIRIEFERALREPLMDAVASLVGRPVLDYGSHLLTEQRVLIEVFVLDMGHDGH